MEWFICPAQVNLSFCSDDDGSSRTISPPDVARYQTDPKMLHTPAYGRATSLPA